jgi:tetratricopeptide (TPR) repeat protein
MDTDVNPGRGFFYPAIPICSGCGGLGVEIDSDEFRTLAQKVYEYRFKYYPVDRFPEPPEIVPYTYLKLMLQTVEEIVHKFGQTSSEGCYAKWFIRPNGVFRELLKNLEEMVGCSLEIIKTGKSEVGYGQADRNKAVMLAIYSGDFEKGFKLFEDHLRDSPGISTLWHDYGILQISINRNAEKALKALEKAITLEPKKALHFYQLGNLYLSLDGKYLDALHSYGKARIQPDWAEFQVAYGVDLQEIINGMAKIYD